MSEHVNHRGWLLDADKGILAAVYRGVMPGTTALAANTAVNGMLIGTPVVTAIPVDSLLFSHTVASGDMVWALNDGSGNSWEYARFDSSAALIVLNEGGSNIDFRVETADIAYAIYADGAKNALVLGSNTDTSSADQLITVSRAARTATAATNYYDVRVAPAGAVTVPAGTTAVVATLSLVEPNITATGTVTRAATLHIASQPTEGGTANAAIYFGAAANIAGTTSITINEDSEDLDFRIESNGMAYAIYSDGGKDALVLGSNTDTSSTDQLITVSRAARTATAATNYFDLAMAPAGAVTVPAGTTAVVATVSIAEPNITATGTVTNATTLYIASQPTEGGTTNSAIYFGAAANIAATTSLTFNEDSADIDFRFEGANNTNMLVIDGGTDSIGLGGAVVAGAFTALTWAAVNRTLVTEVGAALHVPAATMVDQAGNGTTAIGAAVSLGIWTAQASAATRTYTDAATLYLKGVPAASTNAAVTRAWGVYVEAGSSYFAGGVNIGGPTSTNNLIDDASNGAGTTTLYIGNATITVSSDMRVKTDIREWQGSAIELLRQAEPLKEFKYNLPGGGSQTEGYGPNARGKYLGFMAQETRKWAPWVVNAGAGAECPRCLAGLPCEEHTPWTVEYDHLTPLTITAVKELDARLAKLEERRE